MGTEELTTLWGQISAQLGELRSVEAGLVVEQDVYHLADLPAVFASQTLILRVVLTDSLLVSGFFIRPPEPSPYNPPPYVEGRAFREVELSVGTEPWLLPGVLTVPEGAGPFPAVVLVHGSGPNDRDETIGGNRPFRDLAWGLASKGIAVLRYDKRTNVHGASIPSDIGLEDEVVLDALAALDLARAQTAVDPQRVFLLGHSLGGILAPRIGERDGRVAGVLVLAAPARPFFDVLRGQLEYLGTLEADPASEARVQLDSLISTVTQVEKGELPDDQAVLGAPPPYWRELAGVNPVEDAKAFAGPIFVLQGGRDYQSTPDDLSLWQEGLGGRLNFSSSLYPDLNHLFTPGTGTATPEEYVTVVGHVAEEVVSEIAEWILAVGG
jgi:pimeloyl-ACP methyl ester carboxylesterase